MTSTLAVSRGSDIACARCAGESQGEVLTAESIAASSVRP